MAFIPSLFFSFKRFIGVGRLRIMVVGGGGGGARFRILGGGEGGGSNSQLAHDIILTSM